MQYHNTSEGLQKRAKRTNLANVWITFKTLRNETISEIRSSKKSFYNKTSRPNSLHQHFLPKTGGLRLKVLLVQTQPHQSLPFHLLELYTDETDKANILNDFFQSQTVLNEEDAVLPDLPPPASIVPLESIFFHGRWSRIYFEIASYWLSLRSRWPQQSSAT